MTPKALKVVNGLGMMDECRDVIKVVNTRKSEIWTAHSTSDINQQNEVQPTRRGLLLW